MGVWRESERSYGGVWPRRWRLTGVIRLSQVPVQLRRNR